MLRKGLIALSTATLVAGSPASAGGDLEPVRDPVSWNATALTGVLDQLTNDPEVRIMVADADIQRLATLQGLLAKRSAVRFTSVTRAAFESDLKLSLKDFSRTVVKSVSLTQGIDPGYMAALATRESGFKTTARARTSSGTGLYQFTDNTWLCVLKRSGALYGVKNTSDINRDKNGHCTVDDKLERIDFLTLRYDPTMNSNMAAIITRDAYDTYTANFHRQPSSADLYAFHFFGEGDALTFLDAEHRYPWAAGASVEPRAAASNHSVFYGGNGRAKSVEEIYLSFNIY